MPRSTIADLAAEAGVSVSTVDRVLNGRDPVRQATSDRVLEAAERIGFRGVAAMRHRLANDRPLRRLGFILLQPEQQEYRLWGDMLADATRRSAMIHGRPMVRFLNDLSPDHVAESLFTLSREVDAIALVASDQPKIGQAVDMVAAAGTPVFALVSDLTARGASGYVGLDNVNKGRTAAWLATRLRQRAGPVAVLVGNHRYLSQDFAEMGFRSFFREKAGTTEILPTLATFEDDMRGYEITKRLIADAPDLSALYVAGGGIAGVIRALREKPKRAGLVVIGNELTDVTSDALTDDILDVVLSAPAQRLADAVVKVMAEALIGHGHASRIHHILPFDIITAENIG